MIFFECYADESLLTSLGYNSGQLKGGHSFGRSNVSRKLRNAYSSLGLVDEDPGHPQDGYLKHLLSGSIIYEDQYIICSRDEKKNNVLLVLRPDLERLSIRIANEMKINLDRDYGLSSDFRKLHDILMLDKNINKRQSFKKFLSDVADHKTIKKLKELVK